MKTVKLAVIGLNFGKVHARNIHSEAVDAELVAVCDMNPAYAELALRLNVRYYTDYKEMVEREKPDGVIITVPPHIHAEIAVYCLERGIHTFIEKPIAHSPEDSDKIIEAAGRSGAQLLIGHQHRFDPGVQLAKQKIQSGEIGALVGFHIVGVYSKLKSYFKDEWRNKRATGGGPLTSNGIHDLDRIRYMCGEIESVTALMSNSFRGFEVEDTMAVSIKCVSGIVGTYYISDCSHPLTDHTDCYYTEKASLRFGCSSMYPTEGRHSFEEATMDETHPHYYLRTKQTKSLVLPASDNHCTEMNHFGNVIRGLESPRTTGEDAKKSLEVLIAVIESAEKEQTVKLVK